MTKFTNCDDARQVYEPRIKKWRELPKSSPYFPRMYKITVKLEEIDNYEKKFGPQRNANQNLQELESAYETIVSLGAEVTDDIWDAGGLYTDIGWMWAEKRFSESELLSLRAMTPVE